MPWKGEKDPYKIWLSEIILQQTRVEQGWKYYTRFVETYPTISKLAAAKDQDVFKLWEGLGYYSRCKNLLFTAREIVKTRKAIFPEKYEEILALKGVGPYTAAAIASFAYNLPYAVVDGNVFRVLSRYFGIEEPIDSAKGKHLFAEIATRVLNKKEPGIYNQAIMDFGAAVCKPFSPGCATCGLHKTCKAYRNGMVNRLPVKEKTLLRKNRWFYYFLFEHKGKIFVHQRTASDIWQNLFEFYLLETGEITKWDEDTIHNWLHNQLGIRSATIRNISPMITQQLTHQQIRGQFISISLDHIPEILKKGKWVPRNKLSTLPFPKLIAGYLGAV